MKDREKQYRFCMLCKHAVRQNDDVDPILCTLPKGHCPHKEEIEDAERKEE